MLLWFLKDKEPCQTLQIIGVSLEPYLWITSGRNSKNAFHKFGHLMEVKFDAKALRSLILNLSKLSYEKYKIYFKYSHTWCLGSL